MMDVRDCRIEVTRGGTTSVRVIHLPSGLVAERSDVRSQIKAREECLAEIEQRLAARPMTAAGDDCEAPAARQAD